MVNYIPLTSLQGAEHDMRPVGGQGWVGVALTASLLRFNEGEQPSTPHFSAH